MTQDKKRRKEKSWERDYRKHAKGRFADRNYITSFEISSPKITASDVENVKFPDANISIRIQESHWIELQRRLEVEERRAVYSNIVRGFTMLPVLGFFAARGFMSMPYALALGAGAYMVGRPLIEDLALKTPWGKNMLQKRWNRSVGRSNGGVFIKDSIIKKNLGPQNAQILIDALTEAVTFSIAYEDSSKWLRRFGIQKPLSMMRQYNRNLIDFDPRQNTIKIDAKSADTFKFSINLVHEQREHENPEELIKTPQRTNVAIKIVNDIDLGRSFQTHGTNTIKTREVDPITGFPVDPDPVYLRLPIKLFNDNEIIPDVSPERAQAIKKLMHPNNKKLRNKDKIPATWFYTKPGCERDPSGKTVFATIYKPDHVPATVSGGAYNIIKEHAPELTSLFKDKNRTHKATSKLRGRLAEQLRKENDENKREELKAEIEELDKVLSEIGGTFTVKKAVLKDDGLPPDDMNEYETIAEFDRAEEFHQYVEKEILGKNFQKTYFWNTMTWALMDGHIEFTDKMERELNRTLGILESGNAEFYLDKRKGGFYTLTFNPATGNHEIRVGGLKGGTYLPVKIENMNVHTASQDKQNVMKELGRIRNECDLIENPYEKLAEFKAYAESKKEEAIVKARKEGHETTKEVRKNKAPEFFSFVSSDGTIWCQPLN